MAEGIPTKSSVWSSKKSENEPRSPPVQSLIEIMSEELADQLQEQDLLEFDEEQRILEESLHEFYDSKEIDCSRDYELALQLAEDPDYSADAHFALELQRQFDREAEIQQQLEQGQASKSGTKIALASDRFEYSRLENELDHKYDGLAEEEELETSIHQIYHEKTQSFPPCGFIRTDDGQIITKHDKEVGQRKNCQKMMKFPTNFNSGDIIEERLSSKIYNDLQMFTKTENKRAARLKDKELKATSEASVDVKTRLILLKWINNSDLDRVEGIIAIGKESTVLHGICDEIKVGTSTQEPSDEKHFAVKVYKQSLNAFRNRGEYVKDDIRFKNPRSVLKVWTEKEYLNLQRLRRAEMPCPTPLQFKKHVLLMTLIQDAAGRPAPKLRNVAWESEEEKGCVFGQVKDIMVDMYNKCQLVHSDFSEFNLLYSEGTVYVIDVAQAVDLSHPRALAYLSRDIENILTFFEKNLTEGLPTRHELFTTITDIKVDSEKDLLSQIESFQEQNMSLSSAQFRAKPGDYDLIMADKESENAESDSDEED